MKIVKYFLIAFILFSTISAQSFSVGPQIGLFKAAGADKISILPGGAVRINFDKLSFEASYYSKTEKYFNGEMTAKSNPFTLSGIVYVLPMIYGEFGIGWYSTEYTYSDSMAVAFGVKSEKVNDKGYHVGAGAQLEFGPLLLTGDLRYVFMTNSSTVFVKNSYYTLIVGMMYKF